MGYKCTLCGEEYEDSGDLGMHLMNGHGFCELTGEDKEEYEAWLNNPEFAELRKKINDNRRKQAEKGY